MEIALKKMELIEWLIKLNDKSTIKKVEELRNQSVKSRYEAKLRPMSSRAYKSMLERGMEDYKNGRTTSQEDLEKESENW
jgi:hypothetical protein